MNIIWQWAVGVGSLLGISAAFALAMVFLFSDECLEYRNGLFFLLFVGAIGFGLTIGMYQLGGDILTVIHGK